MLTIDRGGGEEGRQEDSWEGGAGGIVRRRSIVEALIYITDGGIGEGGGMRAKKRERIARFIILFGDGI